MPLFSALLHTEDGQLLGKCEGSILVLYDADLPREWDTQGQFFYEFPDETPSAKHYQIQCSYGVVNIWLMFSVGKIHLFGCKVPFEFAKAAMRTYVMAQAKIDEEAGQ